MTTTAWFDVRETPPPFNEKILVMLCDLVGLEEGFLKRHTSVHTVRVCRRSYKDDRCEITEYSKYESGGFKDFQKYQFEMSEHNQLLSKRTSNDIIFWAKYPEKLEDFTIVETTPKSSLLDYIEKLQAAITDLDKRVTDMEFFKKAHPTFMVPGEML